MTATMNAVDDPARQRIEVAYADERRDQRQHSSSSVRPSSKSPTLFNFKKNIAFIIVLPSMVSRRHNKCRYREKLKITNRKREGRERNL